MTYTRPVHSGLSVLALAFLLVGCGGGGDGSSQNGWTVEEGGLTLEGDLLAGDDENYYFGQVTDVAVRADGRVYVADGVAHHVKVLAPDGTLRDSIGRKGDGPGEFRQPSEVFLAHGDSLYVLHSGYFGRLSAFGPTHEFAYETSFQAGEGRISSLPREIVPIPGEAGYLVAYSPPPRPGRKSQKRAVRRVGLKGMAGDTLFTYPPAQAHIEQRDRGMTIRQIPFARGPRTVGGPEGNVHYAWSDSLGVRTYGPDGEVHRTIDIPFEPVPVTQADRERALEGRSEEGRAAVEDKIPSTKPAFEHFLVDDQGRYWFGRPTANPDSTNWWVADPKEKRVVTTTLPSEVRLMAVKDGRAYGRKRTTEAGPLLVRYRLRITPDGQDS